MHDKYICAESGTSTLSSGSLGSQSSWAVFDGPFGAYYIKDFKGRYLSVEAAGGKVIFACHLPLCYTFCFITDSNEWYVDDNR
jgi:hypothetical protein